MNVLKPFAPWRLCNRVSSKSLTIKVQVFFTDSDLAGIVGTVSVVATVGKASCHTSVGMQNGQWNSLGLFGGATEF